MLNRFYRRFGKRAFDLALAVPALVVFSPIMLVTALVVRFGLGRGVLFVQERPGLNAKPFTLYKFRTMLNAEDSHGQPLPDEQRLTRLGCWLRGLSLDELPQLWNVVRGDLSIVGPRPLVMRYLPRYSAEQARRHEVRPGITGWAQINGRNNISWDEKFQFDIWYVDHVSFLVDLKIIFLTAWKVLCKAGISAEGHATMPEFLGSSAAPSSMGKRVSDMTDQFGAP